MTVQI